MKLFDDYEAVRFQEENLIFITKNGYLYYIYNPKYKLLEKYNNAGNDELTVSNYKEVTREEIIEAFDGVFPKSEKHIWRKCVLSDLHVYQMMALYEEDYPKLMSDNSIYATTRRLLAEADIKTKVYGELKVLFDNAMKNGNYSKQVLEQVKQQSLIITGRNIYKKEIEIVDGHDGGSYFWIMPVRVYDYSDTNGFNMVAGFKHVEMSIEEDDVSFYLTPFLNKYYDDELEANKNRVDYYWEDENGIEQCKYVRGFEWYLTHNFYTYESINKILRDMRDTIDALQTGRETEYTIELKEKTSNIMFSLIDAESITIELINEYKAKRLTVDDPETEILVDFYQRFIYRMEYMVKIGQERGYNLISVMGP